MAVKKPDVPDLPEIQKRPGVELSNRDGEGEEGAYGCLVKEVGGENKYILTCSHVALGGSAKDHGGKVDDRLECKIRARGAGKPYVIGELYYCRRDLHNDTALIRPKWDNNTNEVEDFEIKEERPLDLTTDKGADVFFLGCASEGLRKGKIHTVRSLGPVKFPYGSTEVEFHDMILIGRKSGDKWKSISQKGDSGSVILDKKHHAIGLLVGGNKEFTYALPIHRILQEAKVTIA